MPFKQVFETALDAQWSADEGLKIGDKPGDIRWERDSGGMKAYKCFISSGALDFVARDVVFYVAATGYIAHTVTATLSESSNVGAGVSMAAVTTAGVRFWAQLTGPVILATTLDGTTVAGDALTGVAAVNKSLTISAAVDDFIVASSIVDATDSIFCAFPF